MLFWSRLLQNHVLANLTFALVIIVGALSYMQMPRQQDPTINFNWINIITFMPGTSAEDMEKRVTDPLEDAVRRVPDIKFSQSSTREGSSMILVRFNEMSSQTFDKRINDLRREVQNKTAQLPDAATEPYIAEITSSSGFPTAMLAVYGQDSGENLHQRARLVERDLERIKGIDTADATGWREAQLVIRFNAMKLEALGVNPTDIMQTIAANFKDVSAGEYDVGGNTWLVRLQGAKADPNYLASLPIVTQQGEVEIGRLADVELTREDPEEIVDFDGNPAVMLSVTKQPNTNTLKLIERIKEYIDKKNRNSSVTGVSLALVHDETLKTREALGVMQTNALFGLILVMLMAWLFLGLRVALLTSIGIPFILAGTFILLRGYGETLNISVLLGVVISLGMLVDDAVVIVEAIYYRIQRGADALTAALEAIKEVATPVTVAVMTTCAAFLPLMLIPGIIGKFMKVIPMVVCTALAVSLIEAFWMLPSHMLSVKAKPLSQRTRTELMRESALHWLRLKYTKILTKTMRYPLITLLVTLIALTAPVGYGFGTGKVKFDFFASDPSRLFFVNVYLPTGGTLEHAQNIVNQIKERVDSNLTPEERNTLISYSGQMFTETSMLRGSQYAQIMVSLAPKKGNMREVGDVIEALREPVNSINGPKLVSFFNIKGGPPSTSPVDIKVKGQNFDEIRHAARQLKAIMEDMPELKDVEIDETSGQQQLNLELNLDAIKRANLNPTTVSDTLRLLVDGSQIASTRASGEELKVYVRADSQSSNRIEDVLNFRLTSPTGQAIPLQALVRINKNVGVSKIKHYKFKRTITVSAGIDKALTNEREANDKIKQAWAQYESKHPNIELDFSGLLDDLNETINSLGFYFLIGVGLIYLILGTQFKSYFQPFLIITTVPLAFCGVVIGLLITGNPLSLMGLYGVVALAGIAVNAAIVLISAANDRLKAGMSVNHAIIYAARRRVVPIIITALTTIAGLFSLATGLGGHSLLWGPVATAIVWGLAISTLLTLFIIPILYRIFMSDANKASAH